MIHIYRFPQLAYAIRDYKFYDENSKLLSYATSDSEVIIKEELKTLKVKVDYLSGSFTVNEEGDQYLVCYYSPNSFWSAFVPSKFGSYFQFKAVSKQEYLEVVQTKKFGSLQPVQVSPQKARASRIMSLMFIVLGGMAFYLTDFELKGFGQFESTRLLSLILVSFGIVGVIWNYNKFTSIYAQSVGLVLLSMFFIADIFGSVDFTNIFLLPIIGACLISAYFYLSERKSLV